MGDNLLHSHNTSGKITCLKKKKEKRGWRRNHRIGDSLSDSVSVISLVRKKLECCKARSMFPYVEISFLKLFLF